MYQVRSGKAQALNNELQCTLRNRWHHHSAPWLPGHLLLALVTENPQVQMLSSIFSAGIALGGEPMHVHEVLGFNRGMPHHCVGNYYTHGHSIAADVARHACVRCYRNW